MHAQPPPVVIFVKAICSVTGSCEIQGMGMDAKNTGILAEAGCGGESWVGTKGVRGAGRMRFTRRRGDAEEERKKRTKREEIEEKM